MFDDVDADNFEIGDYIDLEELEPRNAEEENWDLYDLYMLDKSDFK